MRRASNKKVTEKKKKTKARKHPLSPRASKEKTPKDVCYNCAKSLAREEPALFVEEEVGRVFCSEACIAAFFGPEIERLEKEYLRRLSPNDLSSEDRERLGHLRWITLQEADEVWREKTLNGDYRFTLISEFKPDHQKKSIWCVCICLLLRGEPSFLYIAFPTKNAAMVNAYRKGERVELVRTESSLSGRTTYQPDGSVLQNEPTDKLADAWTEDETLRAELTSERRSDDIPAEEFNLYQSCLEQTLESPDEVWSMSIRDRSQLKLYHFIRHYPEENPGIWYVIAARETENEEQIEILDAFPTRDAGLVDRYRRGNQEVGTLDARPMARVVH